MLSLDLEFTFMSLGFTLLIYSEKVEMIPTNHESH